MIKAGSIWTSLFKVLARTGGSAKGLSSGYKAYSAARAARAAAGAAAKSPTSVPIVKGIDLASSPVLNKYLGESLVGGELSGKSLRKSIDALAPAARKEIASAAKSDLSAIGGELERLRKLRGIGLSEGEYKTLQSRMRRLQAMQHKFSGNMRNLDRTAWGKTKRGLMYTGGAGLLGLDASYFGPETYKALKEKRYGDAAVLGGEMALFHALPLAGFGRAVGGAGGRILTRAGRPIERLVDWGNRTNGITGWVARHPILSTEIAGTPLGLKTQINEIARSIDSLGNTADDAGNLARAKVREGSRYVDAAHMAQGADDAAIYRMRRLRGAV